MPQFYVKLFLKGRLEVEICNLKVGALFLWGAGHYWMGGFTNTKSR